MSRTQEAQTTASTHRSRTLLVSFLGAVVRKMGGWMPIGATVELLAQSGLDASSVRTAVFRLKKRGWLESESRSGVRGYALTATALEALAAGDQVIWHARQPADLRDGWCLVNFSVPESARAKRHQLTAHLTSLGFGNTGSAVWIAPARMLPAAQAIIAELNLSGQCAVFVGHYAAGQDLTSLVRNGWDIDEIDRRYKEFIDAYEPEADRLARAPFIEGKQALITYLAVIDHWRKLPFRDPGLPLEVLTETWSGSAAVHLFERLVAILEGRALAHAAPHWPSRSPSDASGAAGQAG
ncbi:PaaX family transcriptional regulator C-terminal domain-containing protein [Streptomyces sp. NPDC006175]|uniref:PaaX family transcriptional regulator n=1 Tax=unclassified Streptomyces TaxID=2593676 RepID=UPI0033ACB5BB